MREKKEDSTVLEIKAATQPCRTQTASVSANRRGCVCECVGGFRSGEPQQLKCD